MEQNMDPEPYQEHAQCDPLENPCDECREYWNRMQDEGFWIDGVGWTDKAKREWNR